MTKAIALVDGNNFYVSCERIFRPNLKFHPTIVMSNNDGCAIARSQEVKDLGIRMGEPIFKVKDLIQKHNIKLFSANFNLYGNISSRVVHTLKSFSPEVEVYSIDESFIDLTAYQHLDLTTYGHKIRQRIDKWVGIPTCVGIAPSKTLAKLANEVAKKNKIFGGVCNLMEENTANQLLPHFNIEDVWGIGRATAAKLHAINIHNANQLRNMPLKHARKLGGVVLERLVQELRGSSCLELELLPAQKKGTAVTRSFGTPVEDFDALMQSITHHASRAAEKLRAGNLLASQISVFVRTSKYRGGKQHYGSHTLHLQPLTSDTRDLVRMARQCLNKIYKPGFKYTKSGVLLDNLYDADHAPLNLFKDKEISDKKLMETMDRLNKKFGRGTLFMGAMSTPGKQQWMMRQNMLSQNYLTDINEVLTVYV